MVSLSFLNGAVLVPGLEACEENETFDATLAAMCGLAPWCRTLVWLAPQWLSGFLRALTCWKCWIFGGKEMLSSGFL